MWVILGRGVFAACFTAVILVYAYYVTILETARQVGLMPTIEIRTQGYPTRNMVLGSDLVLDKHPTWNVVLVRYLTGILPSLMLIGILQTDGVGGATEVRALWGSTNGESDGQCINSDFSELQTSRFDCPLDLMARNTISEFLFGLNAS